MESKEPIILEAHKEGKWLMEIKKIQVKKNDIIILKMKEDVTERTAGYLVNLLTKTFPDNKSIVLCKDRNLYPLPEKILNDMGWYKREEEHKAGYGLKPDTERPRPKPRPEKKN